MKNAYKKFAYYYDEVMQELNYDLWVEFVEPYIKKEDKILDLACGSATFATMLKLKGYDVEASDLSEEIIEIANEKRKINRLDFNCYVADMTNFKLDHKVNVITCFFDSVNFLSTKLEIKKMFDSVYHALADDGYFIFDIFSKELMNEYSKNIIDKDYKTFKINWTTKLISNKLKHNIIITEDDESFEESYYEYYYDIKDVLDKRFEIIKIAGDFNDDLLDDDERILIVLKKK